MLELNGLTRSHCLSIWTFAVLSLAVLTAPAHAATATFEIEPQDLSGALKAFAVQSHREIFFAPELARGRKSNGIKGKFDDLKALNIILEGTGLNFSVTASNAILVRDPSSKTESSRDARPLTSPTAADPPVRVAQVNQTPAEPQQLDQGKKSEEKKPALEEIVVTGTNIHGIENKTTPLEVFDRDAIDRSGYSSVDDFIRSLPQNFKGGNLGASPDGMLTGFGFLNPENASGANLRGLGNNATLTLINGHRVAASVFGSVVDLSMIPMDAVDRIEVLTDASSAVYGSDAVGGVVNIVLRDKFEGALTNLRFDTPTQGGGDKKVANQTFGGSWDKGSALTTLQVEDDNRINATDRSFSTGLRQPTDIYPSDIKYSGVFSGHYNPLPELSAHTDLLYVHSRDSRNYTYPQGKSSQFELLQGTTAFISGNGGVRWSPIADWQVEAGGTYSHVDTEQTIYYSPLLSGYKNGTPFLENHETVKEADLKVDGPLLTTRGGVIRLAVGASHRTEDFSTLKDYTGRRAEVEHKVSSEFAEIYIPIVGRDNPIPLIHTLDLSAAVRHDTYTMFGSSTNPKVGIFWSPQEQLGLRASYSTSFRVPNPYEQISSSGTSNVYILPGYALPGGGKGNLIIYPNTSLIPEKARNFTVGLDLTPRILPGSKLSLNYYNIVFNNRIVNSPGTLDVLTKPLVYGPLIGQFATDAASAAFLSNLASQGYTIFDTTGGGGTGAGLRYAFPYGLINAGHVSTSGVDVDAGYTMSFGQHKLQLDVDATEIREIRTAFCAACAQTELSNTYGQPLHYRARATAGWSFRTLTANASVNYANAYQDTNVVPEGRIPSFTTVDVTVRYTPTWPTGMRIGLNLINVLNRDPPLTAPGVYGLRYDPANGDPVGRIVSAQIGYSW